MESLSPFGQGNPQPIVALRDCELLVPPRRIGRNGNTATLVIRQGNISLRAVGFGMGDLADLLPAAHSVHVAAQPFLNTFNGRTSVELQLRDIMWGLICSCSGRRRCDSFSLTQCRGPDSANAMATTATVS